MTDIADAIVTAEFPSNHGRTYFRQPGIKAAIFSEQMLRQAKPQGDTPNMNNAADQIVRDAKKERKRARKADAKRKATVAESLRRRAAGLAALERIATQESGPAAVEAARALAEGI